MKSQIVRLLACLVLLLPSACQTPLGGGGTEQGQILAAIVERGVLRVVMSGTQPPLNALTPEGELIGLEVDLAAMLANAMGVRAEVVGKPFPELLDALEAGEVDLVLSGLTITARRNTRVAFAGPYFISGKSILTSSEALAKAADPSDINLPHLRLAALESSTSELFVTRLIPEAVYVPVKDYDTAVEMLRRGEVDALVADYPICLISAVKYRDDGLVTLARPLSIEPVGAALPASDPLFMNLVQNYLNALQQTGILAELTAHWIDGAAWISMLDAGMSI